MAELAKNVNTTLAQAEKQLPTPLLAKAGPRPQVQLLVDDNVNTRAMLTGVRQALARGGFDVVQGEQPGALKLAVRLNLGEPAKGLRQGEVLLTQVKGNDMGVTSARYSAVLPAEPREATYSAMGEAAITANVGHLRELIAANSQ